MKALPHLRSLPVSTVASLFCVACLALSLTGCVSRTDKPSSTVNESVEQSQAVTQSPAPAVPQAAPGSVLVFDMAHGEIFGPDDTTPLGTSQAIERMRQTGFEVRVNSETISKNTLADASGLIIAGPMRPLTREEYIAVTNFVKGGGTLLLSIHVPFPVLSVPAHWGLPVAPFVMVSGTPAPGIDPGIFVADDIEKGYLTEGVSSVFVVSGWPVQSAAENAATPVKSGSTTWIDADGNGSRDESETASFGVVGSATLGKGHVIVIGDDAIFANVAINEEDNLQLLDNILKLMSGAVDV